MNDAAQEDYYDHDDAPPYLPLEKIDFQDTFQGLLSLALLGDDMFLRMQAFNIQIVDQWTTGLEYQVLKEWFETESTPPEAAFLNAQSQMWIMAVYEVLRTWHQRVREISEMSKNGVLQAEIDRLAKDEGYVHHGKQARIVLLEDALKDPEIVERIERDKRRVHIAYGRISMIRVNLTKHETRGQRNSIANSPGYGRINMHCGSLDYQLEAGRFILGNISRRDIADSLRALAANEDPPDEATIASFDAAMKGPSKEDEAEFLKANRDFPQQTK